MNKKRLRLKLIAEDLFESVENIEDSKLIIGDVTAGELKQLSDWVIQFMESIRKIEKESPESFIE